MNPAHHTVPPPPKKASFQELQNPTLELHHSNIIIITSRIKTFKTTGGYPKLS